MSKQKTFANGLYFNRRESAPDFVIGNLSCQVDEFIKFLNEHKNSDGRVNLNILKSLSGKPYIELDDWVPDSAKAATAVQEDTGMPF